MLPSRTMLKLSNRKPLLRLLNPLISNNNRLILAPKIQLPRIILKKQIQNYNPQPHQLLALNSNKIQLSNKLELHLNNKHRLKQIQPRKVELNQQEIPIKYSNSSQLIIPLLQIKIIYFQVSLMWLQATKFLSRNL